MDNKKKCRELSHRQLWMWGMQEHVWITNYKPPEKAGRSVATVAYISFNLKGKQYSLVERKMKHGIDKVKAVLFDARGAEGRAERKI